MVSNVHLIGTIRTRIGSCIGNQLLLPLRARKNAFLLLVSALLFSLSSPLARGQQQPSADVSAVLSTTAIHAGDKPTIAVVVVVHDGLHAQSHAPFDPDAVKFELTTDKNNQASFGEIQYPPGLEKTFPNLGKLSVYEGQTIVRIPVMVSADAKSGAIKLSGQITFQACNEESCFPPETVKYSVDTAVVPADQAVNPNPDYPAMKTTESPTSAPTTEPAAKASIAPTGGWLSWLCFALILAGFLGRLIRMRSQVRLLPGPLK
jgi:hypothetical protein